MPKYEVRGSYTATEKGRIWATVVAGSPEAALALANADPGSLEDVDYKFDNVSSEIVDFTDAEEIE